MPAELDNTFFSIQQIMNMHWHLHLLRQAIMCNHMEFIFALQLCTRLYTGVQVLQPAHLIPGQCSTRDPVLLIVIFPAFKQLYWTRVSKISRFHSGHQSSSVRWQCRRQEVNNRSANRGLIVVFSFNDQYACLTLVCACEIFNRY